VTTATEARDASSQQRRPLRIACSGLVAVDHGSVSSAGFEVLRELLKRGHHVDLFSTKAYVYPASLIEHEGLGYVDCSASRLDEFIRRLGSGRVGWVGAKCAHRSFTRRIVRAMRSSHEDSPYDVELFLGQWAFGRVVGLPVVSWVQGPPGTDARSIRRHRHDIVRLCGVREYALLRAYALYKSSAIGLPAFHHTDVCICGSQGSAQMLVDDVGLNAACVKALPYPIDLAAFAPERPIESPGRPPELLWVGRVVPRKRLDLFLDAGALLIENGWDITLTLVGGFAFAEGYRKLIEGFPHPERLTYLPQMAREEVRARLQSAAVLIQPSEEENFGSSVAEALACGTPVVVGPTNGTADYMSTGGLRFSEYTPQSLATTVTRVLYDLAVDPSGLNERARLAAVDQLSVERVTDGLERVLTSALSPPERGLNLVS
jgi:glycosyltransferase involved in cell wall biosynthesis